MQLGHTFQDDCFEYTLIEEQGVVGWQLKYLKGVTNFKCKAVEQGYPVISLQSTFEFCIEYTIDLSEMDTSNVINMSYMFQNCRFLI